MLHQTAQSLPVVWRWPVPRRPRIDWTIITMALIALLVVEIAVLTVFAAAAVAWPAISARLAPASAIAAEPPSEPELKVAYAVAPAPVAKILPVVRVEWKLADTPVVHALFVDGTTLCGVRIAPVVTTWCLKNGTWTGRRATPEEEKMIIDRSWRDFPIVGEVLGHPQATWATVTADDAFTVTRGTLGEDTRDMPRLFLHTEKGWIEIVAPDDEDKAYGFVRLGDTLYATIGDSLWQAKLKNP